MQKHYWGITLVIVVILFLGLQLYQKKQANSELKLEAFKICASNPPYPLENLNELDNYIKDCMNRFSKYPW